MPESPIEWTDYTWNPYVGCTKVNADCRDCYMFANQAFYGQDPTLVRRTADETFKQPIRMYRRTGKWKWPDGSKVFTCSFSDFFHEAADAWRPEAWEIIRRRPGLTFQILTKRPQRIADHLPEDFPEKFPNVWLGVSAGHQAAFDAFWPILAEIPAPVRFLSAEPLTMPLVIHHEVLPDWVIAGGESGKRDRIRQMHPDWARHLRDQCESYAIPFFFKQWGMYTPEGRRVDSKKGAGRLLDGREHNAFPTARRSPCRSLSS